jgi:hypothetical protein
MYQLNESSIEKLYNSSVRAFPDTTLRQHAVQPIIIESLRWMPFVSMKTLFVKGNARNEDRHYTTIILFKEVNYNSQELKLKASDGKIYKFAKLSLENNNVSIRCSCPDFKWRFNYYNHLDESLFGKKRKKYEGTTGVSANPKELPGMCKHIMATTKVLFDAGLFN